MISKKLKTITHVALIVIYLHGLEEIITGFYHNDSTMAFLGNYFNASASQFYWVSHVIWWVSLPILFIAVLKIKKLFWLMVVFGSVFFIEIHHVVKALFSMTYYPGMITAIIYPFIGFFYWRELINNFKKRKI
ncbi:MAG: HXXEE domain-containing protein [Candidatus Levybacteria bacterium]|nr:HXXEE domain-containing protein [Candidatus Levybacteria bacterium]